MDRCGARLKGQSSASWHSRTVGFAHRRDLQPSLASEGDQSSASAIGAQSASTSSINIVQGRVRRNRHASARRRLAARAGQGRAHRREGPRRSVRRRAAGARAALAARRASRRRSARTARWLRSRKPNSFSTSAFSAAVPPERRPRRRSTAPASSALERRLELRSAVSSSRLGGERHQAFGQARQVPQQRRRLAAEGVQPALVEIGGDEVRVVGRQEPLRAVVEALAGDVHVVGVEHAVDEAGRHPLRPHAGDAGARALEESQRRGSPSSSRHSSGM